MLSKLLLRQLRESVTDPVTPAEVRTPKPSPSNLPYCPILSLIETTQSIAYPIQHISYADQFYMEIGTVVHKIWQASMSNHPAHGKRVWGSWECSNCKKELKFQFRPKSCSCGGAWIYVEADVRYRNIFAKIDMVTHNKKDLWAVGDLKTIGLNGLKHPEYLPQGTHKAQVRSYGVMMWVRFKIKINKLIVLYASRESPDPAKFLPTEVVWNQSIFDRTVKILDRTVLGYRAVRRFVNGTDDLEKVLELRPCHSIDDYRTGMKAKFIGKDCPLLKFCTQRGAPKLGLEVMNTLNEILETRLEKGS